MKSIRFLGLLLLSACAESAPPPHYEYKPIVPLHSEAEEARLKLNGEALLSKWTECEMKTAVTIARTSTIDPADGVKTAYDACKAEREAWIDSQVAIGWPRDVAEHAADNSQLCVFPIVRDQIEMTRRNASTAERQAYVAANASYSCTSQ
jgi:hypothetical protein